MNTSQQTTLEADGLAIFDDVREVRPEPLAYTALQVIVVVLSYSLVLGIAVVVIVTVVQVLWPVLIAEVFPWLTNVISTLG